MTLTSLLTVLFCCAFLLSHVACERYCGIALSTGHDEWRYYEGNTDYVLQDMRDVHANYVQVAAYAWQVGVGSVTIRRETDVNALTHAFRRAKAAGLKVFFKPVIELEDEDGEWVWRGRIKGSWPWFNKLYIPYMTRMAALAEREGVDVMSIGSEYRAAVNQTQRWRYAISKIRAVYSGKLTYIGNHDAYWNVKFWRQLDFISIAAYFRLINYPKAKVPTYNRTKVLLEQRAQSIEKWRRSANLTHMQVLIAEVGYQSKGGLINYYVPWQWDEPGPLSFRMQARMYQLFLQTFLKRTWSLGVMMWHFELDRNAGKTWAIKGYTPQNKPALWIMKRHFQHFCRNYRAQSE